MKSPLPIAAGVALAVLSTGALAHGKKADGHAQDASSADEIVREQKPWGVAAAPEEATRTVEVSMHDTMRFDPERISVEEGETVRFVVTNAGEMMHEFVLGTRETNDEHAAMMVKFPGMEHDEPYMAQVAPDGTGEIVWTLNRAGDFDFACLIAGHYQAGMVGSLAVDGA